ncbi:hypothetical protein IscW_ISCW019626 [Ixodes scapularis]|uniref:Uncharacterized protein n=1 Tax=Ixodes scapularis TaxID=6945 RepID=B7PUD6_IXOSC|nr:hypothetical protein IscW_ISCW019626 [Ixodes scapularis]|eukprot:XP_002405957.1 hypothetical protein IscW_ISCW019626 [Ixodes scapularis]
MLHGKTTKQLRTRHTQSSRLEQPAHKAATLGSFHSSTTVSYQRKVLSSELPCQLHEPSWQSVVMAIPCNVQLALTNICRAKSSLTRKKMAQFVPCLKHLFADMGTYEA